MPIQLDLDHGRSIVDEVAGRLAQGLTPTSAWYTNDEVHELEREAIFGRTWQLVGAATDLRKPGDYFVADIDEFRSYIVMCGDNGNLRAFANACPHRGTTLLTGSGCVERIRCPYHAWTFDLSGRLRGVPGLPDMRALDLTCYGLAEAAVDTWGPFVFLNPDAEAGPLTEHLGALPEVMERYGIDLLSVAEQGNSLRLQGTMACNWKIAVENALECYHCPTVHPGFRATVDLPNWHIVLKGSCVVQGTTMRADSAYQPEGGRMSDAVGAAARGPDGSDQAMFHWIFPNNSISLWPGPANSFNFARWVPLGPHSCRWETIRWWPADVPDSIRDEQWNFISEVGEEDHLIVERVHRGVRSGLWRGGPFMLGRDLADSASEVIRDERGPYRLNSLAAQAIATHYRALVAG